MRKIAATRNYKMAENFGVIPRGARQEQREREDLALKQRLAHIPKLLAVIKGLKDFMKDKGFDPETVKPSGGWHTYQLGSNHPDTSNST